MMPNQENMKVGAWGKIVELEDLVRKKNTEIEGLREEASWVRAFVEIGKTAVREYDFWFGIGVGGVVFGIVLVWRMML